MSAGAELVCNFSVKIAPKSFYLEEYSRNKKVRYGLLNEITNTKSKEKKEKKKSNNITFEVF
jgi:hypothetical protein